MLSRFFLTFETDCATLYLTFRLNVKGCEIVSIQRTIKALADPIRRDILNLLKKNRMAAGAIASHFEVTDASISRHLSVLKDADLIRDTREGKFIIYEINTSVLEEVLLYISDLKGE